MSLKATIRCMPWSTKLHQSNQTLSNLLYLMDTMMLKFTIFNLRSTKTYQHKYFVLMIILKMMLLSPTVTSMQKVPMGQQDLGQWLVNTPYSSSLTTKQLIWHSDLSYWKLDKRSFLLIWIWYFHYKVLIRQIDQWFCSNTQTKRQDKQKPLILAWNGGNRG